MNYKKLFTVVAIVLISLAFLVVLTGAVLIGTGIMSWKGGLKFEISDLKSDKENESNATTPPAGEPESTEPTAAQPTVNGVSYSGTPEEVAAAAGNTVAQVGELALNNGQLQINYWMNVYNDMYYLYYYFGVDFNQPLDQQVYDSTTGQSWQEAFLEYSLMSWSQMAATAQYAQQNGFTLDEEGLAYMENLDQEIQEEVEEGKYESAEKMVESLFGAGVSVEDYKNYKTIAYYASAYMTSLQETLTPTMEEIESYFTEHEAELLTNNVYKDMGNLMDVRHILLQPESEEEAAEYTEEQWEACRVKAQALLDQWKAGEATEDSFAQLANEHSTDPGSNTNGGLYTDVYEGQMVTEFEDWVFDESRVYGDTGLVKTSYGYHIMFFVEKHPIWINSVREVMLNEQLSAIVDEAVVMFPMEENRDQILLGQPGNLIG